MEIHFEIENRCLQNCMHCSSCASGNGERMQYTKEDMYALLKGLDTYMEVYLTGGEPLLHPGLEKLIDCLKHSGDCSVGLFTSGIREDGGRAVSISDDYARRLAENGLKVCCCSVYSCQREGHDRMTKYPGSFEMTKSSIRALTEAGIEVRFNTVVTSRNRDELGELIEMAGNWGASEVRLLKLIRHGRAKDCWTELGLSDEEYLECVTRILRENHHVRVTASGLPGMIPCRKGCPLSGCPAGKGILYITYRGEVYPCASVKDRGLYRIGSLTDRNIAEKVKMFAGARAGKKLCTPGGVVSE